MTASQKSMLKIYGERNTGTNYLAELISNNLETKLISAVVPKAVGFLINILPGGSELMRDIYFYINFRNTLGWKHSLVNLGLLKKYNDCLLKNVKFVTITKNPYSWLLSLYKRPYHQYGPPKPDLESFLTSPWRTVGRENAPRQYGSPVILWNQKNASYIQLAKEYPTLNIKYEDLLSDPKEIIERISTVFSINWKRSDFVNIDKSTKEDSKDFSFYRDYYLAERWKEKLSQKAVEIINEQLDRQVLAHFGYEIQAVELINPKR